MRAFASCLAASLLALAGPVQAVPARVASLNLCTDELLLLLAAPGQIASVTHLSHQRAETPLWQQARRYPRNDGSLLSVAGQRPDLVLTMGGGPRDRARISARLGLRTLDLPYPMRIADIETSIRTVAHALGRERQGAALIGRIEALKRTAPRRQRDALWLSGGGRSLSSSGLGAEWLALAGLRQRALPGDRVTLETLLVRPPQVIVRSDYRQDQYSGEQRWLSHPLARRVAAARTLTTEGRRWTCMGPLLIDEIARLRLEATR